MRHFYISLMLGLFMCVRPALISARDRSASAAPISIGDFGGSGLAISDAKLSIDSQEWSSASYTITNNSGKTLLFYISSVSFYRSVAPAVPIKEVFTADGWFLNGSLLGPGEHDQADLNVSLRPQKATRLLKVEFNLDYAEFSDGSTWGTPEKKVMDKLDAIRQDKLEVEHFYKSQLKGGLAPAELGAKIESDLREEKPNGSRRTALIQMQIALKSMGPDSLAGKIQDAPASIPVRAH